MLFEEGKSQRCVFLSDTFCYCCILFMQINRCYDSYMRYYHYPSSYPTEELAHHPRERQQAGQRRSRPHTVHARTRDRTVVPLHDYFVLKYFRSGTTAQILTARPVVEPILSNST